MMSEKRSEKDKTLEELMSLLNNEALSTSTRLGIMLALYYEKKLTFADLLKYTRLPKSSLSYSLQILEDAGLIQVVKVPTLVGPRTEIRITERGKEIIKAYLEYIKKLEQKE